MKKLLIVALALVLALAFLVGCNSDNGSMDDTNGTRADYDSGTEVVGGVIEVIGEWAYLGTPWFRFYDNGDAVNLSDGEQFTWNEDGSLDAILYESWSVSGDTLTITWAGGATFEYTRVR